MSRTTTPTPTTTQTTKPTTPTTTTPPTTTPTPTSTLKALAQEVEKSHNVTFTPAARKWVRSQLRKHFSTLKNQGRAKSLWNFDTTDTVDALGAVNAAKDALVRDLLIKATLNKKLATPNA